MALGTTLFIERLRKAIRSVGIGIAQSATQADSAVQTIKSGSGVPTAAEPTGSLYLRSGGGSAATVLYVSTDSIGTWVALAEVAATDVLAESTPAAGVTVDGLLIKDGDALFLDNDLAKFGTGSDITFSWNATKMLVGQAAANSAIDWGVDGAGIDQVWYGDTASANLTWDQSADALIVNGAASVQGLRTSSSSAAAITTTRVLTLADAGGVFNIDQDAAFDIDVPDPTTGPGCRYTFVITDAGAQNVTITCAGAATFVGTITIDDATIPATGSTLTFATGAAVVGDSIEMISLSTTLYFARCISSGTGGITVA